MKMNNRSNSTATGKTNFVSRCADFCQSLVARIDKARENILAELRTQFGIQDHLLRLALNEAEALAWESGFPQLVFPELAREKAQALATWQGHQRELRHLNQRPSHRA